MCCAVTIKTCLKTLKKDACLCKTIFLYNKKSVSVWKKLTGILLYSSIPEAVICRYSSK